MSSDTFYSCRFCIFGHILPTGAVKCQQGNFYIPKIARETVYCDDFLPDEAFINSSVNMKGRDTE